MKYKPVFTYVKKMIAATEKKLSYVKDYHIRRQLALEQLGSFLGDVLAKRTADYTDEKGEIRDVFEKLLPFTVDGYVTDLNGKLSHYFISDELEEFLTETKVNKVDIKELFDTADCATQVYSEPFLQVKYIVIRSHKHAYFGIIGTKGFKYGLLACIVNDDEYNVVNEKTTALNEVSRARFLYNFILYCHAYPDAVKAGVPHDMHASYNEKQKGRVVKAHDVIKKMCGAARSPHIRQGYFRHYPAESEWYKNVKGKTIYICPTFIKGRAYTVDKE